MRHFPGLLACLALALAPLAACASAPAEARPQRVAFLDYRNGTHLDGVRVTQASLRPGATLRVGRTDMFIVDRLVK